MGQQVDFEYKMAKFEKKNGFGVINLPEILKHYQYHETMSLRIAIVDDEPAARSSLRRLLLNHCPGPLDICEAGGIAEARQLLQRQFIDLLLLDVEMEDGTGFDLLDLISPIQFRVVFTTAHDDFAIRAFRYNAIDYLLKPVDPDELQSAVCKARENHSQALLQQQIANLLSTTSRKSFDRIALDTGSGLIFVNTDDITRIESCGNFAFVFLADGERYLVSHNLKAFEEMLPLTRFYRPHQSHIVNKAFVKKFLKYDGGYAVMQDGAEIPVARRKKEAFLAALQD
jgi:two-component system, LytTR family, response regulator